MATCWATGCMAWPTASQPAPDCTPAAGSFAKWRGPSTRLWHRHPAVRTQRLTFGEKAADWLKHWFGTWIALGLVTVWIAAWIALQRTSISWDLYPFILLNLCLSCLAAVQGIIPQLSANRGDNRAITVVNADGSNLTVLTNYSTNNANPGWSPDGSRPNGPAGHSLSCPYGRFAALPWWLIPTSCQRIRLCLSPIPSPLACWVRSR